MPKNYEELVKSLDLDKFNQPDPDAVQPQEGQEPTTPDEVAPVAEEAPEGEQEFFNVGEIIAAPVRGAEEAVHGFYGLLDWAAFDSLPDWDEKRIFGHAESTAGIAATGLMQFVAGAIATGGVLGVAGKAAGLAGKAFTSAKKVESGIKAFQGAAGVTHGAKGLAAAAGRGAITDFAFFDAEDARLSDAVKGTFLENDVTRFLEQDEEDSELTSRLKNAIEGLGIGAAMDSIFLGMRKVAGVRKAKKAAIAEGKNFTTKDAAKAYRDAEVAHATDSTFFNPETGKKDLTGKAPDGPITTDRPSNKFTEEQYASVREGRSAYIPVAPKDATATGLTKETEFAISEAVGNAGFNGTKGVKEWLDRVKEAQDAGDAQGLQDAILRTTEVREGDEFQRIMLDLADIDMTDSADALGVGIRGYMHISDKAALDQTLDMSRHFMADVMNFSEAEQLTMSSRVADVWGLDKIKDIEDLNRMVGGLSLTAMRVGHTAVESVQRTLKETKIDSSMENAQLLDLIEDFVQVDKAMESVYGIRNVQGRSLRANRYFSESKGKRKTGRKKHFNTDVGDDVIRGSEALDQDAIERSLIQRAGVSNIQEARDVLINQLNVVSKSMDEAGGDKAKLMNAFMNMSKGTSRDVQFGKMTEYWLGNLLNGPKTHVANLAANFAVYALRPVETAGAAVFTFGSGAVKGNRAMAFGESWKLVRQALDEVFEIGGVFKDTILLRNQELGSAVKDALVTGEQKLTAQAHELSRRGDKAITPKSMREGLVGRMARGAFGTEVGNTVAGAVGTVVGKQSRAAFHALAAGDELFKHLNFRMTMRTRLAREARESGKDVGLHVSEGMNKAIRDGQALSRRQMRDEAARSAEEAIKGRRFTGSVQRAVEHEKLTTRNYNDMMEKNRSVLHHAEKSATDADTYTFQTRLDGDSGVDKAARLVSKAAQDIPIVRLFAPFITTPANLLKFAGRRTALDPVMYGMNRAVQVISGKPFKSLQESNHLATRVLASGDQQAINELAGRWSTAVGSTVLFGKLALNGIENDDAGVGQAPHAVSIVGRGPLNADQHKLWVAAGNQEYSVKMGDQTVSLERLEPFGTLLGLVADIAQYSHFAPEDSDPSDLMTGTVMAAAHAFTSKTYLQGLNNLATVLTSEDSNKVSKITTGIAASFQPGGQALKQLTDGGYDSHLREIRSLTDALYARTPGLSDKLEARRDVLGRPMKRIGHDEDFSFTARWTPFPITTEENKDPVYLGLAQTGHAWKRPSTKLTISGVPVDLLDIQDKDGESAYSRYQQLASESLISGKTSHQRIKELMGSEWYQRQSQLAEANPGDPLQDPRVKRIRSIIEMHRSLGASKLRKEFPEILEQVRSAHNKRSETRGIFTK